MGSMQEHRKSSESAAESLPFLENDIRPSTKAFKPEDAEPPAGVARCLWDTPFLRYAVFHGIAFCSYAALISLVISTHWARSPMCDSIIYSPAQAVIEYEVRPIDGLTGVKNEFTGYPNPKSDEAWAGLMEGINLMVSDEEMLQLGQTSLAMSDGSGYLATLGVYHELHCVKQLRKWIYKDYYYSNQTQAAYDERSAHADHCLEFLRQAAMCHGDVAVNPFRWLRDENHSAIGPTVKEGALHRCVRWDRLSGWAKSRSVDLYDPNLFMPEQHA